MTQVAPRPRSRVRVTGEAGRVTAFVAAMTAGILALAGLTLDGGLALAAKVDAIGHAQEAARAGAQQVDLVAYRADGTLRLQPTQATAAARAYLSAIGHRGRVSVTDTTVTVTVTATQRTQLLRLVGVESLVVDGSGSAQPQRGVTGVTP